MLSSSSPSLTHSLNGDEGESGEVGLVSLYEKIQRIIRGLPGIRRTMDCSLVTLSHEDIYSSTEKPTSFILQMEYLADILIKAEPLSTGLATDVHGQLTVLNKGTSLRMGSLGNRIYNFHFRVRENSVEYFYPGSRVGETYNLIYWNKLHGY